MPHRAHAPVLDYFVEILRAHRASGRLHAQVAHGMEAYVLHVTRLADEHVLTGVEALVAANRAVTLALALPQLPEDRHEPR